MRPSDPPDADRVALDVIVGNPRLVLGGDKPVDVLGVSRAPSGTGGGEVVDPRLEARVVRPRLALATALTQSKVFSRSI